MLAGRQKLGEHVILSEQGAGWPCFCWAVPQRRRVACSQTLDLSVLYFSCLWNGRNTTYMPTGLVGSALWSWHESRFTA